MLRVRKSCIELVITSEERARGRFVRQTKALPSEPAKHFKQYLIVLIWMPNALGK